MFGMKKDKPVVVEKSDKIEPKLKGRLPASKLDRQLLNKLWDIFNADGEFLWTSEVGTGGDILGKQEERPKQAVNSWDELIELMQTLPRIDSLTITAEVPDKGVIALAFRNFAPASGKLVVYSEDEKWAEDKYFDIIELFEAHKDTFPNMIHTRIGFGVVQSVIPLALSCVVAVFLAAFLIPIEIRRTQYLWWITVATSIVTLRLAYTISDKLIIYAIKKYPYIRFS
ncbi:hypothetical protein [Dendrosporobacter sp. 1207_IL3150]|uniref:hypothetical protein n=1 Tax=Dendrosporobacter sp. 1207_IL3150 TaxID=3084054 RepID=UPI002FDB88E4